MERENFMIKIFRSWLHLDNFSFDDVCKSRADSDVSEYNWASMLNWQTQSFLFIDMAAVCKMAISPTTIYNWCAKVTDLKQCLLIASIWPAYLEPPLAGGD